MAVTPGSRIGPYEIVGTLGAGGMGEVYRARDARLAARRRDQGLPDAFAQDADRRARFEREARTLASLNHPRIAMVHGLEEAERRLRAGHGAGRGTDARRVDRGRPANRLRSARRRWADRRRARGGARAGDHPPRSQARQHQGAPRRHRESARFRPRQGLRAWRRQRGRARQLSHDARGRQNRAGDHSRHRGLHEPRAGARTGGRQARRHLGVRLRALRNARPAVRPSPANRRPTSSPRSCSASPIGRCCRPMCRRRSARCCAARCRRTRAIGCAISATRDSSWHRRRPPLQTRAVQSRRRLLAAAPARRDSARGPIALVAFRGRRARRGRCALLLGPARDRAEDVARRRVGTQLRHAAADTTIATGTRLVGRAVA